MFQDTPGRLHRRLYVYKDGLHALTITDKPGSLVSTASPPPGGAPKHPFLDGTAHQAIYESELATLLTKAADFDAYLSLLIQAGYDIAADDALPGKSPGAGARMLEGEVPVGAAWQSAGQFTALWWQPVQGQMVCRHARLSVYQPAWVDRLLTCLQGAVDYESFCSNVQKLGLKLVNFRVRSW
ncbi:MAG: hypothetical protein ACYCZF_13445 [Anaerolineae bacterium]